jgi:hypothetical protein
MEGRAVRRKQRRVLQPANPAGKQLSQAAFVRMSDAGLPDCTDLQR